MTDAIVSIVSKKIKDFIIEEAALLGGVKNEVKWLQRELKLMQCFIMDAEHKQQNNNLVRSWVSDVREIAYDTEDVLDIFMLKFHQQTRVGFLPSLFHCFCIEDHVYNLFHIWDLHVIGKEINCLRQRMENLSSERLKYELGYDNINNETGNSAAVNTLRELRRTTPLRVARNVVGLEDEADKLLAKLVDDDDLSRLVISIWGMGGLGKTTLAGKLYHDERVQKRFMCRAWVCVSQDYNTQNLLLKIAKSFMIGHAEELRKMSEDKLVESLHQFLNGQHPYLLVMDDLWDQKAWNKLEAAFPDNHNGSRVIVTTRIKKVALGLDRRTLPLELRKLNPAESLELFYEEAYGNETPTLMDWENKMVERCHGLPLAIVVLAGFFRANENSQRRQKGWKRLKKDDNVDGLLSLGFNDLSRHQKLCFLYLGLFPEDFSIRAEQVIRLWVAVGLIEKVDHLILEDVARGYLNELANRSLIQVEKTEYGRIIHFRLYGLLRDLAIQKGKDINFVHVDNNDTSPAHSSTSCRHRAVYNGIEGYLSAQNHCPRLHSLLIFNNQSKNLNRLLEHLAKQSKLLRVLHVDGNIGQVLVDDAGQVLNTVMSKERETLIHLRYLKLQGFGSLELQSSIGNFKNLQTLDFGDLLRPFKVSSQIFELKELRYLIGFFMGEMQIDNLTKLQTLRLITYENWMKINPEKLPNLRELTIYGDSGGKIIEFSFDSIGKLKGLQYLQVKILSSTACFGPLRPLSNCPNLTRFELYGDTMELPAEMHQWFPKLEHLKLVFHETSCDPLYACEKLPNLVSLHVFTVDYKGPHRIKCTSTGFPQLQTLFLLFPMTKVEEWHVEEGAMPKLRSLEAPYQSKIPERLRPIWTCSG